MANNILPGEHDWMYRLPGGNSTMGFPSPAPAAQPGIMDRIMGGLLGQGQAYGGLLSPQDQQTAKRQALLAMGANLMAASGPSPTRVSFGQALGPALLAGQQAQRDAGQDMLQAMLLRTKLQQGQQPKRYVVKGALVDENGKPIYEAPATAGDGVGDYQPGDYTPASWSKFLKSKDPADLERYVTPRQEYSPSYQNVTRTLPDGSTQQGTFDTRSGAYNWSGEIVPPGQKKRVESQAAAEGEATGAQASKAPAAASMDYVMQQIDNILPHTMQGGIGGVFGRAGAVFDYKDAQRFDNLKEQLSTELRTVYRIPGEGTLSDREQAQYGIQLPDRKNHPDVNRAILNDLRERTRLRLQTPVQSGASPSGSDIDALLNKYAPK